MYIDKIFEIDEILNFEEQIARNQNAQILNVSYWNTGTKYQDYLQKCIKLDFKENIFDYKYTYDIPKNARNKIIKKLTGIENEKVMCLLTPSSTCSITNMINYLKLNNYHKICILTPAYFSIEETCKIFRLNYEKKQLIYSDKKYHIPKDYILKNEFDAVWITSPVYSTGEVFERSEIDALEELMENHILVIADETLALPGQELSRVVPIGNYFYSIYSPHKSLFINTIKFSAILCPIKNDDFLEQWIDVLGGGLLHSNITAISHYLSPNFDHCVQHSIEWFRLASNTIKNVIKNTSNAYCNVSEVSSYKAIYFDSTHKNPNKLENVMELIEAHHVSYIPGILNGCDSNNINCFRINLSLTPSEIENALYRILHFYA